MQYVLYNRSSEEYYMCITGNVVVRTEHIESAWKGTLDDAEAILGHLNAEEWEIWTAELKLWRGTESKRHKIVARIKRLQADLAKAQAMLNAP